VNELEEKLKCALADVGTQVGEILRCIIQAEVAAQVAKIQQLQDILSGSSCGGDVLPPTI
jgi:hypothetical protein